MDDRVTAPTLCALSGLGIGYMTWLVSVVLCCVMCITSMDDRVTAPTLCALSGLGIGYLTWLRCVVLCGVVLCCVYYLYGRQSDGTYFVRALWTRVWDVGAVAA